MVSKAPWSYACVFNLLVTAGSSGHTAALMCVARRALRITGPTSETWRHKTRESQGSSSSFSKSQITVKASL